MRKLLWALYLLSSSLTAQTAPAPTLTDPTRPSGLPDRPVAGKDSAPPAEKLQLSLIRLGAKPLAVINGQSLRPGQTLGAYTLTALSANTVRLQGPKGPLVLTLSSTTAVPIKKSSP